jgi:hypothetical protein
MNRQVDIVGLNLQRVRAATSQIEQFEEKLSGTDIRASELRRIVDDLSKRLDKLEDEDGLVQAVHQQAHRIEDRLNQLTRTLDAKEKRFGEELETLKEMVWNIRGCNCPQPFAEESRVTTPSTPSTNSSLVVPEENRLILLERRSLELARPRSPSSELEYVTPPIEEVALPIAEPVVPVPPPRGVTRTRRLRDETRPYRMELGTPVTRRRVREAQERRRRGERTPSESSGSSGSSSSEGDPNDGHASDYIAFE